MPWLAVKYLLTAAAVAIAPELTKRSDSLPSFLSEFTRCRGRSLVHVDVAFRYDSFRALFCR